MSDLINQAKYANWKDTHTFESCRLNRQEYGEFLADYLIGEHYGFVLNIDGSWGAGKTEFLKRLYSMLLKRNHPTVYIDAWESDFSKVPLSVVASELIKQLELFCTDEESDADWKKTKKHLGALLKSSITGIAGAVSLATSGTVVGATAIQPLLALINDPESLTEKVAKDHAEQVQAIVDVRASLSEIAVTLKEKYELELPIVVLIDELDRCRPSYSIEMLEVVKHFFATEGLVFAIATDTGQLCHSIKAVYGQDFDSLQYLKRFFNRRISLPKPEIATYINSLDLSFLKLDGVELFPLSNAKFSYIVERLATAYRLQMRDIDQLLHKVNACLKTASATKARTGETQYINVPALIVGLIEHDRDYASFNDRGRNNPIFDKPSDTSINWCSDLSMSDYIEAVMKYTILLDKEREDEFGEATTQTKLPNSREDFIHPESPNHERTLFFQDLENHARHFNGHDKKYWLWEHYKRVIELAGNID
ncbi:KAP family P-loop NTPase fold protein [Motilimonas pumila]|uniref:KAP NTPase domain-containing protein n=1 Tax=Motilimonas pumila TaxID=2303987 RepID=A0A418YEL1_9GAMM|nr:P-loop NTPase fold protein [Motilimonas pumila]RJG47548.1 hypothetical protein D1Z90_10440 [Motilimonas pumila]